MNARQLLSRLPERLATGAFVLHSGLQKWKGDEQTAQGLHGMASGTYPFLAKLAPTTFLRLLATVEITTGLALLVPFVPRVLAGALLTGFSGGLMGLYLKTPGLREPGSLAPTPDGLGIAKDVWLLGVGTSLVLDGILSPAEARGRKELTR
ncbi:DoxX family membrane protein [Auraticoccus sp. F435]|uniref:DoxX family membrane protein n=1 Tax=Auraticoccus cholistanensis TaxID=2656650 RepID=A0A6A9UXT2_9ACTN|nr:DoxX family membrane protein [Auraticoccus cholistanensis]MVA76565.1 DoxX family membrane protein [Auraticoccus cholistanensis]